MLSRNNFSTTTLTGVETKRVVRENMHRHEPFPAATIRSARPAAFFSMKICARGKKLVQNIGARKKNVLNCFVLMENIFPRFFLFFFFALDSIGPGGKLTQTI